MRLSVSIPEGNFGTIMGKLLAALDETSILDEAQAMLLNRLRTRFLAEEGPDTKWVPSQRGLIRKAGGFTYRNGKRYTATGTLYETGTLFHSIQAHAAGQNARMISTDVPYAKYLHKRWPFLGFNQDDAILVERLIQKRIKDALA
jgi:hypothetical protein